MNYLDGQNIVVLDLEVKTSPDVCIHCRQLGERHFGSHRLCIAGEPAKWFEAIGWKRLRYLGISIGCYYDYKTGRLHWIDETNLELVVSGLLAMAPLMVSFNGVQFDFALMRAILRKDPKNHDMCDAFKELAAESYDILREIWKVDPKKRFTPGLNSLDAICERNGFGRKLLNGAEAPLRWARGEHATVIDYCSDDVYKTKALFEKILQDNGRLLRGGDSAPIQLHLPLPSQIGIS